MNYFNFNDYGSLFNSTNNKVFYQNALVFEYIIMRMFLINDYYKFLLRKMLQYNFNMVPNTSVNFKFQIELNKKLLNYSRNKKVKSLFDSINKTVKESNAPDNYMEYFLTTFI